MTMLSAGRCSRYASGEYPLRIGVEVGAKQGLGGEGSPRVAKQRSAQGHSVQPRAVPDRRSSSDLHDTLPLAVPIGNCNGGPEGGRVLKSTDGGESWQPTGNEGLPEGVSVMVVSPSGPQLLYAGILDGESARVFRSEDGGETWKAQN